MIEEYEKENYIFYLPFKDPKSGKWVKVTSPFYEEKKVLKMKIDYIKEEINVLNKRLTEIIRSF